MIVLGLAGAAGSGKDTIADYLAKRYGFFKFSFSDSLYREVTAAFDLPHDSILRNRETKEVLTDHLSLDLCADKAFAQCVYDYHQDSGFGEQALSPRQILQWWGTNYRRAQDPEYWVKKADEWIYDIWAMYQYPEQRPQHFVNTSVRFPNEQAFVHKFTCGNVWHIHRDGAVPVAAHVSETPLPVLEHERELWNNDTIPQLYKGVEQLLSTQARFVRMEPMLPPDHLAGDPTHTQTFGPITDRRDAEDAAAADVNCSRGH